MREVYPGLYVGSQVDYEGQVRGESGWAVVHACKEPYHRQALGYRGRGAPKDHPEYLIARRGSRLILKLIDAPDPAYIPKEIIDAALAFIHENLQAGRRVLVHCNLGESRSPSMALLYLVSHSQRLPVGSLSEAEQVFRDVYPFYNPGRGMRGFMTEHWGEYSH